MAKRSQEKDDTREPGDVVAELIPEHIRKLELIEELQLSLAAESDQEKIMDMVAAAAASIINAETVVVPMLSHNNLEVRYDHVFGKHGDVFKGIVFPIENAGLCGWVLDNRQPLYTNDLQDDPRVKKELAKALGITSAALAPLIARGRIIGGLSAFNKTDGSPFTQADVDMMMRFAAYAALVIDNSRLLGEVRREKDKVEYILNSVKDGIVLISKDGVILNMNAAMGRLFSTDPKELVGVDIDELTALSPVAEAFDWKAGSNPGGRCWELLSCEQKECPVYHTDLLRCWSFSNGECYKASYHGKGEDKLMEVCAGCKSMESARRTLARPRQVTISDRTFMVTSEPIMEAAEHDGVRGEVMVFHDVTEEKRLQTERADFVSMMTHDLKTPLTSILGYCELIDGEKDSETAKEMNRDVARNANHMLRMINDFLGLAKVEAGRVSLTCMDISLNAFLKQSVGSFRRRAEEHGVGLDFEVAEGTPDAYADIDQLSRIVDNLVSNALNHVPKGGHVKVRGEKGPEGFVELAVEDDGPGIAEEDLPRVFDKYYTGPGGRSKGSGLGLSIVKALAEAHGGGVSVKSEKKKSTVFSVYLPAYKKAGV